MQMERNATKQGIAFTRVGIDALLNPKEEDEVVESFTIQELGMSVAGVKFVISEEPDKDEYLEEEGLYTVEEELKGLAVSIASLKGYGLLNTELVSKLRRCQRELRAQKLFDMKQTTIMDHLKTSGN